MTTVADIERAITQLPHEQLRELDAWYTEYRARTWDEEMGRDSAKGRLDFLFDEAREQQVAEELLEWPESE